jgi:hypothetical protein
MKKSLLLTCFILVLIAVSCKQQGIESKISGEWVGVADVEIFYTDSLSNTFSQNFSAPMELIYSVDSTLNVKISASESFVYSIEAKSYQIDSIIQFRGKISVDNNADLSGDLSLNDMKELQFTSTSFGSNSGGTIVSKIGATLIKKS